MGKLKHSEVAKHRKDAVTQFFQDPPHLMYGGHLRGGCWLFMRSGVEAQGEAETQGLDNCVYKGALKHRLKHKKDAETQKKSRHTGKDLFVVCGRRGRNPSSP